MLGKMSRTVAPTRRASSRPLSVTISRGRAFWIVSDDPTYLAQLEPIEEGVRKAGVPEE
jgi:hypothetical protein